MLDNEVESAKRISGLDSVDAPAEERLQESFDAFSTKLNELTPKLSELQDPEIKAALVVSADALIRELDIKPELFDDSAKVVLFVAIAHRHAQHAASDQSEEVFTQDAALILSNKASGRYEELRTEISFENGAGEHDDESIERVYDSYTNREMTHRLQQVLPAVVGPVREKLRVTQDNESSFTLRVLDIGGEDLNFDGLSPGSGPDYKAYIEYKNDLQAKTRAFNTELGYDENHERTAWVSQLGNDHTWMSIPQPLARIIVAPDSAIKSAHFTRVETHGDQSSEARTIALIQHEYAHTQGGVRIKDTLIGAALEEIRAEHFSGNKQGYKQEKTFAWRSLYPVTGFDIRTYFDEQADVTRPEAIYEDIAASVGLNTMLEFALTIPQDYMSTAPPAVKRVAEHLGGWNDFAKRLYENADNKAEIDAFYLNFVHDMLADEERKDMWTTFIQMLNHYRLPYVAQQYEAAAEKLSA